MTHLGPQRILSRTAQYDFPKPRAAIGVQTPPSSNSRLIRRPAWLVHFRVSGLKAAFECGLESALGLGLLRTLAEEIGIATEVLCRREITDLRTTRFAVSADCFFQLGNFPS